MKIGVDYYPEHWDRELWEKDAKLMEKTGVLVVRMAEFAWCRLEPKEGEFNFKWLDEAIDVLYKHGISTILGTPTVTPVNWLVEKHSDVLPVDSKGIKTFQGVRSHRCYNSPSLRKYSKIFIDKLTKHYADNPAVIGWQTDNEFGIVECHCENCRKKFQEWLRCKYPSLKELNLAWGNVVWSGEYSSWEQVNTPLGGSPHLNPSFLLDYYRFCSDSVIDFQLTQIEIIRDNCTGHFITHNIWGWNKSLNYYKLFEKLDFVSLDNYPSTNAISPGKSAAIDHDLTRGVKNKNFWVMEELSGTPGCWGPMGRTPHPGMIRAYSWQAISRGADAIIHFRWRSATIGAEQFWHGLIDHSNVPGRRFKEFEVLCSEIKKIGKLIDGTEVKNKVALLYSQDQVTAFNIQPQVDGMNYFENLRMSHQAFLSMGIGTDCISTENDFSHYKIIVAHSLYLLDEAMAKRLEDFAREGGTLIITNRTGVKDMNNRCWMRPLPGPLSQAAGIEVEEYDPIGFDKHHLKYNEKTYECFQWCDIINNITSKEIACFEDDFYKGRTAVTKNEIGKGVVYYIGINAEQAFYNDLYGDIIRQVGVKDSVIPCEGVEISVRENQEYRLIFIINLRNQSRTVKLEGQYKDIIKEVRVEGELNLESYEVVILKEDYL